ncbi:MAG: beta-lactamase family protein [Planctomycetales bacterium]|nr:beta-lactamase family protein [Planctomycetales bacterium]
MSEMSLKMGLVWIGFCLCQNIFPAWVNAATTVEISQGQWWINGSVTNAGSKAEGLLMNVRMVNATFEDRSGQQPEFSAKENTDEFLVAIADYRKHGVNAFTLCLQGGMPGYEGAINSAFESDGSLRSDYMSRVLQVIRACDQEGVVVILGCYYQRQSKILKDETAIRNGLSNVVQWIEANGLTNVLLEIANEYPHGGFVHECIRTEQGQANLLSYVKSLNPRLLVTASGYGDGKIHPEVAMHCDFLTPHWNSTKVEDIPQRVKYLKQFALPIVCNEDDKLGSRAVAALRASVENGAGYGLMLKEHNQTYPFHFDGAQDDAEYYAALHEITHASAVQHASQSQLQQEYFPLPESKGGWRVLSSDEEISTLGGMDSTKVAELRQWLLDSDDRSFAAVVIRHGQIALQVERGNSAINDTRNVKSCAKAICATVLAIASESSQRGETPHRMAFDDRAFEFIPWAKPLSDPRKSEITVKQLLNHTSGITPESTRVPNRGPWEFILGHAGDARNQKLAFDPGSDLDYGTHALYHAALVCEYVTNKPYDAYAIEKLLRPLGVEKWWFEIIDGDAVHGVHPSHAIGLPARELASIGYCMLHAGRWRDKQVIPEWFVEQTAGPTHSVTGIKTFGRDAAAFSHGWELPANLSDGRGQGIPSDARFKPGSGGQLIAFVPSLDLVIARQTGGSGAWEYEQFLRLACAAVRSPETP